VATFARKDDVFNSKIVAWCLSRSMAAVVVILSLKIFSHPENAKLLVIMIERISYLAESSANKTSVSSLSHDIYEMPSTMRRWFVDLGFDNISIGPNTIKMGKVHK